jgi:hypothetical protein
VPCTGESFTATFLKKPSRLCRARRDPNPPHTPAVRENLAVVVMRLLAGEEVVSGLPAEGAAVGRVIRHPVWFVPVVARARLRVFFTGGARSRRGH